MNYSSQLLQFLVQSVTDNLKTRHYDKSYKNLKVKVSFGQGNQAKVPWISFLRSPNTTSNGIYPVYLLYKEQNLLILSFGISDTKKSLFKWNKEGLTTIEDYFIKHNHGKPPRYGKSCVFKVYNSQEMPNSDTLDKDLNEIIEIYTRTLDLQSSNALFTKEIIEQKSSKIKQVDFKIEHLTKALKESGLLFNNLLVTRFIASLLTKPFVLLSGLSGSGKTKLAQSFAQWICQNENQYSIVPVGSDWTNREPLLGYPNGLNEDEYVKPENSVLQLILSAEENTHLPYFLILDEMNLSHVERYFADFLSVMESKNKIKLHSGEEIDKSGIPSAISLPKNLFIIGTVNIDETTYMFSPKVLDRANAIEFRITVDEMRDYFSDSVPVNMNHLTKNGEGMAFDFLTKAKNEVFNSEEDIKDVLIQFFVELQKTGAEYGYRSASEIVRLLNQLTVIDPNLVLDSRLDIAIMQKLLPKLHGSRNKLCRVLEKLAPLCLKEEVKDLTKLRKEILENKEFDFKGYQVKFPISLKKIVRMYRGAIENGFASYAEA